MSENDLPLVSIVTPSFNQAAYLEQTIRSVLEQDYPRIEYMIVDGGSADGSVGIIKQYADKLAWWVSEVDKGQTDAINKGFGHAKGQILAWINSDDTYEPGAVSAAVEYLQAHPDVGMVYANCNFINEEGDCDWQIWRSANGLQAFAARICPHPAADHVLPRRIVACSGSA